MKISMEMLWGVVPVPVLALDRMPGRLVGLSMGVFIVVRRDYLADRPTIIHELEHCKQFWRGGIVLHMLRYYASRSYRLKVEVEAFRAEIAACPAATLSDRIEDAARALSGGYHVGLDVASCRRLLTTPFPVVDPWQSADGAGARDATPLPPVMARSIDATRR